MVYNLEEIGGTISEWMKPMEAKKHSYQVRLEPSISLLIRRWPILLTLGLIGVLAGFALSSSQKPRYEAEAMMGISIQYGVIEPLELVVEDRAQNRVAELILADSTLLILLDNIEQTVRQEQGWQDPADLRQSLRLDRGLSAWGFVVTNPDPGLAAQISDLWMEISLTELEQTQNHAWQAVALMGEESFQLECEQYLLFSEPVETYATRCDLEPVSLDAEALAGQLQTEIQLSRGILPVFSFEALQAAEVPENPVIYQRGVLLISGALIGLLIGMWIVVALPRRGFAEAGASEADECD